MHKKITGLIIALVVVIGTTGCQQIANQTKGEIFYGTAEMEQINISSEIAGVIEEIKAEEGTEVTKGAVLAVISVPEADIKAEQAKIAVSLAENEQQRIEDTVVRGKETAEKAAELGLEQVKLSNQLAELMKSKEEVKTTAAGVVDSINYSSGEYVLPGSPIATIINPKNLWVKIYVPEKMLTEIKLNQEVAIKSNFVSKELKGVIASISSEAEFTPMNIVTKENREKLVYEVKINIIEGADEVKSGMLLDVYLQ